jgi:formylglycine-generating enzyme required for sulfatase activity
MKTDCFKLRMRLLTLVFSFAAVLLLMIPSLKPSAFARAPQGKGGEVLAKPTPTTKKTTAKKKTTLGNSRTSRPAKPPSDSATAGETIFWNSIKDSTNPDDFKEYLRKYPNGEFTGLAANRLKTLEATNSSTKPGTTNPSSKNPGATNPNPTSSNMSNLPRTRINQTGIEFVLIPPGSFMMGSNDDPNKKPVHQVTVSNGFYMGRYELTQAQWQAQMGNNPSLFKDCGNCPVENVSWNDAQEFIEKLNQTNDGYTYRLPTEAEWEYACRAGTTTAFAFGDSLSSDQANFDGNYPYGGAGKGVYRQKTTAVGSFQPNAWGLYDMHGNAWEWCQDWYHDSYNGAPADGSAWLSGGEQKYRVLRGGSWDSSSVALGSAYRVRDTPGNRSHYGFRIVALART